VIIINLDNFLAKGLIPDYLLRFGVKIILKNKIKNQKIPNIEKRQQEKIDFVNGLKKQPIAIKTAEANEQHYELPSSFFKEILGDRLKYSCGYWDKVLTPSDCASKLNQSEEAMLELTCSRAELKNDQKILEGFANLAAVAIHNVSLYSTTDQALEARVEELYIIQQIDRDLNATQNIGQALQKMLEAALDHTSARFGTIGLIDHNTETFENIWQIQPAQDAPIRLDDMDLSKESWVSNGFSQGKKGQDPDLSTRLGLGDAVQWHFQIVSDLEDDQALLLLLHSESPEQMTSKDKSFLSRLRDHAIIALKNALLYEELHEVKKKKNEFIGFISHELKNPLTVIKGYADILRKGMAGKVNEEQIDYLSTINHNVKRMNTFIKDLSDQSHIETKSLRLEFESTPVQEVVNEVLHSYSAEIEKKSLKVELHMPFDTPNIWCDRLRLIQVLSNLVSNAIKYTPENGQINIGAEHAANTWDEKGAAEVVHFWVEDNGYGIKPEDQEHLFKKFYRGSDARIKKIPGTGLGLRISKSLVEMMGGKLWFNSTLDEGSSFHFTLPI